MCGIIAYKGTGNAVEICLNGLKNLEYRGYDSWGIAAKNKDKIHFIKKTGKIGEVSLSDLNLEHSSLAIAHTRWGTHGKITKENAHPHLSNNGKIAVVHNGIIENYQELREFLKKNGFVFKSETDTEVIPNLIQYFMENEKTDFISASKKTFKRLEGSFAVCVLDENSDILVAAKKNSPLVIGIKEGGFFAASDAPAFIEHTNNIVFMDDDEYAAVDDEIEFYSTKNNEKIKKNIENVDWNFEQAKKGSFSHFMLKEIVEQKETIKKAIDQPRELILKATKMINDAKGIFFVGCGTSYHACVSAGYQFSKIAKKHVNVVLSSEFRNFSDFLTDETLVVALSQSGETADTIDAIKTAKIKNSKVIAIVNVKGSMISRLADETIMMNSGPEICVLSTKSYTSQLAILLLLAYSVAGKPDEGRELIKKSSSYIDKIIDENIKKLNELAKKLKNENNIFLIGRDLCYPTILEGALKIKEASYIHAEGFAGGELKHGTIALIDKDTPVIALSSDNTRKEILSNVMEIKARNGFIIGIDSINNEAFDYFIKIPEVNFASPLISIIPLQILAYYLAVEKGHDPDKPRNLAKCVSVK